MSAVLIGLVKMALYFKQKYFISLTGELG